MYIEAINACKIIEELGYQLRSNITQCDHKERRDSKGITYVAVIVVEFMIYKQDVLVHRSVVAGEGHDQNGKAVEAAFKNAFSLYLNLLGSIASNLFAPKKQEAKQPKHIPSVHVYNISEGKKHWHQMVHVGKETGIPICELTEESRTWLFTEWLDSMKIKGRIKSARDKQLEKAVELCLLDLCEQPT